MHFRECGGRGGSSGGGERANGEEGGRAGGGQASEVLRASNPAFSDITVGPLYSLATFPECPPPGCCLHSIQDAFEWKVVGIFA